MEIIYRVYEKILDYNITIITLTIILNMRFLR
jgi:hypothetical protein